MPNSNKVNVNVNAYLVLFLFCITEHLGKPLDDYVAKLPVRTYVIRSETRTGLIRARLKGMYIFVYCRHLRFYAPNPPLGIVALSFTHIHSSICSSFGFCSITSSP